MTSSPTATRRRQPIDPRLRARRIEVRREEGRRRLRRIGILAGVAAGLAVAFLITRSPLLDIDRVAVSGAEHTPTRAILRATGLDRGDALLYADLRAARVAVERLPWVAGAEVTRHWPGTVRIAVEERVAAGLVPADGGGWFIADGEGRLLERVDEPTPGLARLAGVDPAVEGGAVGEDGRALLGVLARLPAMLRDVTTMAAVGEQGVELGVVLPDGREVPVRFGPPEDVTEKLLALAAVLSGADLGGVTALDVRVPSAPVVATT